MLREAVYHKIDSDYAYPISKNELFLKIRVKKADCVAINVLYFDSYRAEREGIVFCEIPMDKKATDEYFDYYEVAVKVKMISISYCFELIDIDKNVLYYSNYKFYEDRLLETDLYFIMPYLCEKDIAEFPDWAKDSIVYQIFVDRFKDSKYNQKTRENWYRAVDGNTILGGDLKGITERIDYLSELGINTIYLTPIFQSNSNHKYDITDYYKIDKMFGTKEDAKELVKKAHLKGIKVIFDAVFNHCGEDFFAFRDVVENGEKSKYKEWFDIESFPVKCGDQPNYATFGYYHWMPKLMTKNDEVSKYLIDVATFWITEIDIDGWRLDVASEVDHEFWRNFRKAVKAVKKDAIIIGEIWHDSLSWLQGDQFDTVMNYLFTKDVKDFVIGENRPTEFSEGVGFTRGMYRESVYNILWNLIGSHDTERFLTLANGDVSKLKIAASIQMTFPGTPMIYYGDEVGMVGKKDPDCRRGMYWEEKQNKDVFEYYKKLIKIRKENEEFTRGDFKIILKDNENNIFGFRREYNEKICDIYINNSDEEKVLERKGKFRELILEKEYENVIKIIGKSVIVIKE